MKFAVFGTGPSSCCRKCFLFGINEVTRAVEKGEASLVLVDSSVEPKLLTKHLAELTQYKAVPAACISGLADAVYDTGVQSFSCLAIKPLVSKALLLLLHGYSHCIM